MQARLKTWTAVDSGQETGSRTESKGGRRRYDSKGFDQRHKDKKWQTGNEKVREVKRSGSRES